MDDVVPLELLDSLVPVRTGGVVITAGEEHADIATTIAFVAEMIHIIDELR